MWEKESGGQELAGLASLVTHSHITRAMKARSFIQPSSFTNGDVLGINQVIFCLNVIRCHVRPRERKLPQ